MRLMYTDYINNNYPLSLFTFDSYTRDHFKFSELLMHVCFFGLEVKTINFDI